MRPDCRLLVISHLESAVKQRPRPISKKLEITTYEHDQKVRFIGRGSDDAPTVQVPLPIMYRLYHLGRAYDLGRVAGLHPTGNMVVDYVNSQTLSLELDLLASFVQDPVLQYYVQELEQLLAYIRSDTKRSIAVKCA